MKMGSNHQDKWSTRWGELCAKEEYTEGVGGVQNKKEHKI